MNSNPGRDQHEIAEVIIERPKHKLGILRIYARAFSLVLRSPSIYIVSLLYWILIGAVMYGVFLAITLILFSAVAFVPFFIDPFAGLRFYFGIFLTFTITLFGTFGLLVVIMKAGYGRMFMRLHQGQRPRMADFGHGIVRYSWRFIKGYFHIAALVAIPVIIFYGWLVRQYASYSSLIFESRWNMGLRFEFFRNIDIAWGVVIFVGVVIYLLLTVWDESVVLEGSTFQQGFIRSAKFATRNPIRVIAVRLINYLIINAVLILTFITYSPNPVYKFSDYQNEMSNVAFQEFWFLLLIFILYPILSFTHYLLYIPNLPFKPGKSDVNEKPVRATVISGDVDGDANILSLGKRERKEKTISDNAKTEPDDDFLRLNE